MKKILNEENGKITELQGEINNLKTKLDEKQHTINILLSEINILEEERLKTNDQIIELMLEYKDIDPFDKKTLSEKLIKKYNKLKKLIDDYNCLIKNKKVKIESMKLDFNLNSIEKYQEFIINEKMKQKKWEFRLKKIKNIPNEYKCLKQTKFYSISMTKTVYEKIKKKTGYTETEFDYFLLIDQKNKNIPNEIKKNIIKNDKDYHKKHW